MKRRGRGDGTIRQRSDGTWEARLRYIDPITLLNERQSFYGQTRDEVVQKLDEARGRLRRSEDPRERRIALDDFLDLWLRDVVTPTKKEWTVQQYSSIIENHLKPSRLASMALRDIREVQIQHVLVARSKATPRVQQLTLIVLRRALEQAVKWGMLTTNPARGIAAPRTERRDLRVLSPAEARTFLTAAQTDPLYALYYVALDTGMRQGELFALRWEDVDLDARTIRVSRSVNTATGKVGTTKSRAGRRQIVMGAPAVDVLRAHRDKQQAAGYSGVLVFPSPRGQQLSPSNVRINSFLEIQKVAKIDPPIRFHDLRHTAATLMLGAGVHPKIVSERLGHATIAITMDTYQHVSPTMQRQAADAIGEILSPKPVRQHRVGGKVGGTKRESAGKRKSPAA